MTMINHGEWTRYTPEELPFGYPPSTLFWQRQADGADWYEWTREHWNVQNGADTSGTIKVITSGNVAVMISADVTGLAGPSPFTLYELESGDTVPQLLWVLVNGQFQAP